MLYDGYLGKIRNQKAEIAESIRELGFEEEFVKTLESQQTILHVLTHLERKPEITAFLALTPKQRLARLRKKYTDSSWVELNVLAYAALCVAHDLLALINDHSPGTGLPYRDTAANCYELSLDLIQCWLKKPKMLR